MTAYYDLSKFELDPGLGRGTNLLLTVKSFDLQAIRTRYLESKKNKSGKSGSVERRKVSEGGIVHLKLEQDEGTVLHRMPEPRGIDFRDRKLAIASENKVMVFEGIDSEAALDDMDYSTPDHTLNHPWFSYIHTCYFSPFHEDRILVSSSGLDCIFEFNFRTGEKTYEWFAWENGFNQSLDPKTGEVSLLTRRKEQALQWKEAGIVHRLIDNPLTQHLPTARRAAFINSVTYDPINAHQLLATFFHEGAVFAIDRSTGKVKRMIWGLKNPHGGRRQGECILATSTGAGTVVSRSNGLTEVFDFSHLNGKPESLDGMEWLQNTTVYKDLWITIDSNRNTFIVFQPGQGVYNRFSYNSNWAVQDLVAF